MSTSLAPTVTYNTQLMAEDMAIRGWEQTDLAKKAKVADMTVSRFLGGRQQTARTCKQLARALGYSSKRYVIRQGGV